MTQITCFEDIKHAFYINLESRTDRKEHMENELLKIGITATRFNAISNKIGAIGCSLSHLKLLQNAIMNNLEHILILEDDILFLDPELFKNQFKKFMELHRNNWDVVIISGNNMPPYQPIDDTCIKVSKCQTTTGYLVNGHYIRTLTENIKMGVSNLIRNPQEHTKYAIDKFWFILQKVGRWYLIIPLSVIQKEGYSDIEKKQTNYKKIMLDIDKKELFEAARLHRYNNISTIKMLR